jgi:integrase
VTELNNWQQKMLLKVGKKRLQNIKIPFNGVMTLAYRSRLISENPFLRADKISVKKNKEQATQKAQDLKNMASNGASADDLNKKIKENRNYRKDPFSEDELKTLFSEATGFLKNYIQIAFFTAMRPSEIIALEWGSVNFEEKFVLCAGAITGKETEDERELNKSPKSVRVVYLADQAVEAFKEQYKLTGKKSKYVFLTQYGKPYASVRSIREKSFKKLLEDSKVRNRRLYDLRHSYASINLSQNRLPILFVSEQMGHSDASVTLKAYSAYIANSSDDSLALVQKAFINF